MNSGQSKLNLENIVAIKIDTEGYEGRVLAGAQNLLEAQKPLIIAECGHIIDLARETALAHGYVLAEREGDQLVVTNKITSRLNGFFIHPDRFDFYPQIGLLKA